MADRKPPRVAAGERAATAALLQFQRESALRKVQRISDEQAGHADILRELIDGETGR